MEKYSSYKDSGVQWLGEIPSHWSLRKMKYAFVERSQKGFPKEPLLAATQSYGVIKKADYEVRTVEALKNLRTLKLVEIGDFVISLRSFQGGIEYSHCRGIISPAYTILTPTHITADYFKYLGKSSIFINLLKSTVTGIREGQNIDYNKLKSEYMPIPPIEEQQSMASYLDKATAEIDKAIAQQQHMIDLLNERKQIIIQRAVTKGMDENVEMKDSGVEWIGDIPAHWQVKKLKYIANTNSGSTPRNISGKGSPSSNIKWVRTTDLNNDIVTDTSEYLSKQEMASASCPLLEPNTVLISMYGGSRSFGKIGILGIEATINQALCSISANDDILPKYLFYYLQSVNKIWMKFAASSRKDPNLNQEIIRNIHIAYPQSKDEQDMVVGMLEKSIREVNNGISQYESLISTLQERKQIIISEVVTGKIKVS